MRKHIAAIILAISGAAVAGTAHAQSTLQRIKDRGAVACGTSHGVPGYSVQDEKGVWTGFDIDWCRALAAAIFDDPMKAAFKPLTSKDRLTAVQTQEIDVLPRTTTWTLSRDAGLGLNFTSINYYDGQGFKVRKSSGITSAKQLEGATICVNQGTTNELNAADFFRTHNLKYQIVTFQETAETLKAYESGRCDTYTTDASQLYANRLLLQKPDDHIVLPEIISKEPLGAWVRQGDDQWFDIVRWSIYVMIGAEELGITKANAQDMLQSKNPDVRRLLGVEGNFGEQLGLTKDWGYRIIRHVGNYGESFDKHLGKHSRLKIERGYNRLWTEGGLMYAPPIR